MVLEPPGGCCKSIIGGLESQRTLLWSHLHVFTIKYRWFWSCQAVAVNSLFDGLESRGGCCAPICTFFQWNIFGFGIARRLQWIHHLMVWNLEEVVVQPFAHFSNEISLVVEPPGGCNESIIWWFGISRRLLILLESSAGSYWNPLQDPIGILCRIRLESSAGS